MRLVTRRHGWCMVDLLVSLSSIVLALAVVVPVLGQLRGLSQIDVSVSNLGILSEATVMYAADWNGRQFTNINDELSSYGNNPSSAVQNFNSQEGEHPPVALGWGQGTSGGIALWGYWMSFAGNWSLLTPMDFGSGFGMFRIINAAPFHQYVNGRYFDPTFYAPGDTAPYATAEPMFEEPWEFAPGDSSSTACWSSYCFSPAAMFNPVVMGANRDGTFHDPWDFPEGFVSPPLDAALYPDLKTQILEHNWVQNPPATCNPAFPNGTYDGCEPYYFNHGLDSTPVTLFYDGHMRVMPNEEFFLADQVVLEQSGDGNGLWHRGTPFGSNGYLTESGYDGTPLGHHTLTTFGILGRDILASDSGVEESALAVTAKGNRRHRPHVSLRPPGAGLTISGGP